MARMKFTLPVIHVEALDQAERNLVVALDAEASGVFFINHSLHPADLVLIYRVLRQNYPGIWMGLNLLGSPEHQLPLLAQGADGLWMDTWPKRKLDFQGKVFGGVGFKYQTYRTDLEGQCADAQRHSDVLVTTGPATGEAPTVEKVQQVAEFGRQWGKPVGIASGLTPENVASYVELVDYFLVATGVSSSFTELDLARLKDFVQVVGKHPR